MVRLSIKLAALAAAMTSSLGHAEIPVSPAKDNIPPHTILMFGASWCAPCITELRNIAALASSANPDHIMILWTDGGVRRYASVVPGNVEIVSGSGAQQMMRQYAFGITGLPYSVMIDGKGRKCAEWKSGLTPEAIGQMRATCTTTSR